MLLILDAWADRFSASTEMQRLAARRSPTNLYGVRKDFNIQTLEQYLNERMFLEAFVLPRVIY